MKTFQPSTQILGLGNPLRADDGAGLYVIDLLHEMGAASMAVLTKAGACGWSAVDMLAGCSRLAIVDAALTGAEPGVIHSFSMDDLQQCATLHSGASHGLDIATALALKRRLEPESAPADLLVFGIEAMWLDKFSEDISAPVRAACQGLARRLLEWL